MSMGAPILICNQQDYLEFGEELEQLINLVVNLVSKMENLGDREVSIALIDDEQMAELNKNYRNIDNTTDVLSFPQEEELLGDVIISIPRALAQANEYGHSFKREFTYLLVHGLLHLAGYDHLNTEDKTIMRSLEEEILSNLDQILVEDN